MKCRIDNQPVNIQSEHTNIHADSIWSIYKLLRSFICKLTI